MNHQGRKNEGKRTDISAPWLAQGKALLIGIVIVLLTMGICAGLIAAGLIPESGMSICSLVTAGIGGAAAAITAARTRGKGGGLCGMLSGLLLALFCLLCGFLFYGNIHALWCAAISFVMICSGGIAGYACTGKKRRRG